MDIEKMIQEASLVALGATHWENRHHTIARAAFLERFCSLPQVRQLFAQWDTMSDDKEAILRSAATLIVEEMSLEWVWLISEMYEAWRLDRAHGERHGFRRDYEAASMSAPAGFAYHFSARPGESFADAIERFRRETKDFAKRAEVVHKAMKLKEGYPSQEVEKYTDWFFRFRFLGETNPQIADEAGVDPRNIQRGREKAEEWLNLAI